MPDLIPLGHSLLINHWAVMIVYLFIFKGNVTAFCAYLKYKTYPFMYCKVSIDVDVGDL